MVPGKKTRATPIVLLSLYRGDPGARSSPALEQDGNRIAEAGAVLVFCQFFNVFLSDPVDKLRSIKKTVQSGARFPAQRLPIGTVSREE